MSDKQIVWRKADELELWGDNPNEGDVGAILQSINQFGYNAAIALWHDRIQGGNHTRIAVGQLWDGGWQPTARDTMADVDADGDLVIGCIDVSHLQSEQEANAFGIALNRTAQRAKNDEAKLAALLQDIQAVDEQLLIASGFDGDDLDTLLRDLGQLETPDDPGAQVDKAEELRGQWQTERGQLWVIPSITGKGEHRILCGDSTDADDVARLMGGAVAQGAFTSPPYAEQRKAQYGGTPADEYVDWWDGVQSCVRTHLKEDGSFFVNIKPHCEDGERVLYVMDLVLAMRRRWQWLFVDELCWLRRGFPGDFKTRFRNAFEPVYHFAINKHILFNPQNVLVESSISRGHSPSKSSWSNQSGSGLPGVDYDSIEARPSNVIDIKKTAYGLLHPAMFPVELPKFFIEAYSDNNDLWYDPFLGSGTTIVACEQTGRVGYGMEISEAYTAVCLQRLADMGLEPRLHNGS